MTNQLAVSQVAD